MNQQKKKCELQNNAKKEKEQDNIMQQNNFPSLLMYLRRSHVCKGQLISECLFDILNVPKNQQKI